MKQGILFYCRSKAKWINEEDAQKVCTTLNYIEHFFIFASTVTKCISISVFAFLVGIPIGITNSVTGLKICVIIAGIKKYKSIIKEKQKRAW